MYITVRNILEIEAFKDVELIAGESGIDRRVENVFIMEVPDIYAYIDENGLLLTTLYPIADNPEALQTILPKLAERNIAGVAIKPGRYVDEIPTFMLEQAKQLNLPLLMLPKDANLSELTNQVLTTLLDARTSVLEFRNKVHQQLLDLLLEGADLTKFVYSTARMIDAPVLLLNNELEYLDSSLDIDTAQIKINTEANSLQMDSYPKHLHSIEVNQHIYLQENIFFQPIFAGDREFGYLVILLEADKDIKDNLIIAVEQASFLVAFLFQSEQALLEKERNHLSSFVRDVFNDQFTSRTEILEKSKVFNWKFQFPIVMISIKANIGESKDRLALYYKILDSGVFERMVAATLEIPEENCKVLYFNDSLLCFVSIKNETNLKSKLHRIGTSLLKNFNERGHIGVSISDVVYGVDDLREAYSNSMLVFKIYRENLENESFVHFYTDIGLFRLFHNIKDTSVLEEFVTDKIGAVIEYDEGKEVKLIETLRYYIKNNTNLQKTAEDLYVHYNTMRYRMNKLKELGIHIENGFQLTEVSLACQLLEYLEMKKG